MKLVVEIKGSDMLYPIYAMTFSDFITLRPEDLKGVPTYVTTGKSGEILLWPKPLPECIVYSLVPQAHAS